MKKLLLIGSNCVHTYNYFHLVKRYFDEVVMVTDEEHDIVDAKISNCYYVNSSLKELKNYSYDKMEHLSTKVLAEVNLNQATIDLTFIAFEKGAEGIIIVSNNIGTVVTAAIHNKNTSTPIRTTFNYCEALLIKNITTSYLHLISHYSPHIMSLGAILRLRALLSPFLQLPQIWLDLACG